jgi:antitoxin component YwqK of YwqJK toxin-antitoxin module
LNLRPKKISFIKKDLKKRFNGVFVAECKACNQKGFFLSVSQDGLCEKCNSIFWQNLKVLQKSVSIINKSRKFSILLEQINISCQKLKILSRFSHLNLIDPSPEKLIDQLKYKVTHNDKLELDCYIFGSDLCDEHKGNYKYNSETGIYSRNVKGKSHQFPGFSKSEIQFSDEFGKGIYREFYKSQRLKRELPFSFFDSDLNAHGTEIGYYEGDDSEGNPTYTILYEREFSEGMLIEREYDYSIDGGVLRVTDHSKHNLGGEHILYFPESGNIKLENRENYGKEYYENGKIKAEWTNENFSKKGVYTEYYEDGKLKMQVNYINEILRDGLMHKYYETGNIKELWSYEMGNRKFIKKYQNDGKLISEWLYEKGQLIKKNEFNQDGTIK